MQPFLVEIPRAGRDDLRRRLAAGRRPASGEAVRAVRRWRPPL